MSLKFPIPFCPGLLITGALLAGFTMGGFKSPDTVAVDPETGFIFVSNVNGRATQRDHNGVISLLEPEGKPIHMHFIRSGRGAVDLSAPKGLAVVGPHLYVADLDQVLRFDKKTGRHLGTIDLSLLGARDLTGVAEGPGGVLYVSDARADMIFRIDPGQEDLAEVFARDKQLGHPTGLVYDAAHRRLLVAGWKSGRLVFIDETGRIVPLMPERFGGLKGLRLDREGNLIFSAFVTGAIYRLKNYESLEVIRRNLVTPANLALAGHGRELFVPSYRGNIVFTVPLPPP